MKLENSGSRFLIQMILIIAVIVCNLGAIYAQPASPFHKRYGGTDNESWKAIQTIVQHATNGDGFIMVGTVHISTPVQEDRIRVMKADENGEEQWSIEFSDPTAGVANFTASDVVEVQSGGYAVVGTRTPTAPNTVSEICVFRINPDGSLRWKRIFNDNGNSVGTAICDANSYLAISGWTEGVNYWDCYENNIVIIAIQDDATGTPLWSNFYTGHGVFPDGHAFIDGWQYYIDRPYDIQRTTNGDLILTGSAVWSASWPETHPVWEPPPPPSPCDSAGRRQMFLLKVDPAGTVLWFYQYPDGQGYYDVGMSVISLDASNEYIVAGATAHNPTNPNRDIYLIKTDQNGNLLSQSRLDAPGHLNEECFSIHRATIGGYGLDGFVISGSTNSFSNGYQGFLMAFWNSLSPASSPVTFGGSLAENAFSCDQTSNGQFVAAGSTNSYSTSYDGYLVRTGITGLVCAECDEEKHDFHIDTMIINRKARELRIHSIDEVHPDIESRYISVDVNVECTTCPNPNGNNFQKHYQGISSDRGKSGQQTTTSGIVDGYVIAGWAAEGRSGETPYNVQDYDVLVVRTNLDGDRTWTKTVRLVTTSSYKEQGYDVDHLITGPNPGPNPGKHIVVGDAVLTIDVGGGNFVYDTTLYLVRVSNDTIPQGSQETGLPSVLFGNRYGFPDLNTNDLHQEHGRSVREVLPPFGGYIIAGFAKSSSLPPALADDNFYVIRTDQSGFLNLSGNTWANVYGGSGSDQAMCVRSTRDGGFIVVGHSNSFSIPSPTRLYDIYVVKLSATGALQWSQTIGAVSSNEYGHAIEEVEDGYIICGWTDMGTNGTGNNVLALKIIPNTVVGSTPYRVAWSKEYDFFQGDDRGMSIKPTTDHGYIIAGHAYVSNPLDNAQGFLLKIDGCGNPIWSREFPNNPPVPMPVPPPVNVWPGADDDVESVWQTADGGYAAFGSTCTYDQSHSTKGNVLLVKTQCDGELCTSDQMDVVTMDDPTSASFPAATEMAEYRMYEPIGSRAVPVFEEYTICFEPATGTQGGGGSSSPKSVPVPDLSETRQSPESEYTVGDSYNAALELFPVPVRRGAPINFVVKMQTPRASHLVVSNVKGEKILQLDVPVGATSSNISMPTSALPAGTYFVRLVSGDNVLGTKQIVVQD